jgi:transposase
MISINAARVYLATGPIDGRKSYNTLTPIIKNTLKADPLSGHLFVFYNKQRNLLKALYWDKNGFCLWQKRLEEGRFLVPKDISDISLELTSCQLQGLIQGINWQKIDKPKTLNYTIV